jgi:hypothetical protein
MTAVNGNIAQENMPTAYPTKWSFHNLPLSLFIDQIEYNTVDADIYAQFFDAIKDKEQAYLMKLIKEINLLESKFNLVYLSVEYFKTMKLIAGMEPEQEVMDLLSQHITIRSTDTIDMILSRAKRFITDLGIKRQELDKIMPKNTGQAPDRNYFNHWLNTISKYYQCYVDEKIITVGRFAGMIVNFLNEMENIKRLNSKTNGAR